MSISDAFIASDKKKVPEKRTIVVIVPTKGWVPLRLGDIWDHRDLVLMLAYRDLLSRYKQTFVGIAWAILQPLLAMVVYTVVFGKLAHIPSDGLRYSIFCLAGTLMWQYFSSSAQAAANSLKANVHLLTKVHFPRLTLPLYCVIPPLVDFAAGFVVLLAIMAHYEQPLTWRVIIIPGLLGLAMITALGVGIWLSALTIEYRDLHHILPFLMQLSMFATPVVYSSSLIPPNFRPLFGLNPMAGVISGFRWALYGTPVAPGPPMLCLSVLAATAVLVSGAYYFRRVERDFADLI